MKKVSVLIPCYNEEKSLPLLYPELLRIMDDEQLSKCYEWELLFVNDGSTDGTLELLRSLRSQDIRVNYIDLSRNFGKENAMLSGFDYVTGDCMVIMDADLQHPPTLIPQMLEAWEQGYDDVYAKRLSRGKESWFRRQSTLWFYNLLQKMSDVDVLPNVGDFRLLDRKCINVLCRLRESQRYTKGMYSWIGFRKKEVLFDQQDRVAGVSSWNYLRLFNLAIQGVTSFTTFPLRLATILGLLVSLAAFAFLIYVLVNTLLWGDPVQGYPTMMVVILFLGGIQLLALGIIGEYLGHIYHESKRRPTYVAREYNGELLQEGYSRL
jgi:glycosyltransferase involved in cell wall biosynthesis